MLFFLKILSDCFVPRMDGQGSRYERLLLGLRRPWSFYEKIVVVA